MSRLKKERERRLAKPPKKAPHTHPDCDISEPPCGSPRNICVESICDGEDGRCVAHGIVSKHWFCSRRECNSCHDAFVKVCTDHDDGAAEATWLKRTIAHTPCIFLEDLTNKDIEAVCADLVCDVCALKWATLTQDYVTANGEALPPRQAACDTQRSVPGGGPMTVFVERRA